MSISKSTRCDPPDSSSPTIWKAGTSRLISARPFILTKLRRVFESLSAQGFTTVINLLYGLLCVRLLPVEGYAKFSLLFAFQASLSLLVDVGSTSAIAPLVGERIGDLQLIADYVASLRHLSVRLFAFLAPATVVAFPLLVKNQHWSAGSVAFLVCMLLIFVWFARARGAYGAVLILRRDRAAWYRPPMIASFASISLLVLCWGTHILNEYIAILISVGANLFITAGYYYRSKQVLGVTGHSSAEKRKAIARLMMPSVPNLIFIAIQSQISLMLISIFGRTSGIATLGALTRLVQVFVLFSQVNPVLLEPYFAKLPQLRLKEHYLSAAVAAASLGAFIVLLARIWPGLFLWVLGPKYSHLHSEVVMVMILGAIYYVSGVLFCMNTARRFVYWWSNLAIIVLTISVQALFLWKADLSSVTSVLIFNICSNLVTFVMTMLSGVYGFIAGPRRVDVCAT